MRCPPSGVFASGEPSVAVLGFIAVNLRPATQQLLLEILEGLDVADPDLPELRVGAPGRTGSRYWLYGKRNRSFQRRRPFAQFDELASARLLRKVRKESSGTY